MVWRFSTKLLASEVNSLDILKNASLVGVRATSWAIVLNDYDISSFLVGPKSCLYFISSILISVSWESSLFTNSLFFLSAVCVERHVLGQVITGNMNELYLVFNWGHHNLLGWKSCRSHLMMFPTCTSLLGIPICLLKFSTKSPTVTPVSKWIVQRTEQLAYR